MSVNSLNNPESATGAAPAASAAQVAAPAAQAAAEGTPALGAVNGAALLVGGQAPAGGVSGVEQGAGAAAFAPLTSIAAVKVNAPAGAVLDEATTGWLKETAVAHGLSQAQLDAVVGGYNRFTEEASANLKASTERELKKEYGARYDETMARASDACRKFNQLTNGGLSEILEAGLGNHPGFVRFMVAIAEAVSESALPGTPKGSGESAVSTAAFLQDVLNKRPAGQ